MTNIDDALRERLMVGVGILLMIAAIWLLTGCGSTQTKVVYEKVEVPAPYPAYVENIKPLGPEPNYQYPHTTVDEAQADPTTALVIVGQDLNSCRGDSKLVRRDYAELVKACSAPPPTPIPTVPD